MSESPRGQCSWWKYGNQRPDRTLGRNEGNPCAGCIGIVLDLEEHKVKAVSNSMVVKHDQNDHKDETACPAHGNQGHSHHGASDISPLPLAVISFNLWW